ncbi:MAG: patatin-like phospholipase family protein [Pseudomonadota bacterium]
MAERSVPNDISNDVDELLKWDSVFDGELAELRRDTDEERLKEDDPRLAGLCLSGGGVRSAIFCGGVLEYFRQQDLMHRFDYLSTVSGGGYTGAAQSYWQHQQAPNRSEKVQEEHYLSYIRHLRSNISYLMPTGFRGVVTGAYVVLRSILINLFIWVGLAAFIFWLALQLPSPSAIGSVGNATGATAAAAPVSEVPPPTLWQTFTTLLPDAYVFLFFTVIGIGAVACLIVLVPVFSIGTIVKVQTGYKWRRGIERVGSKLAIVALFCLPIGLLPEANENIQAINKYVYSLLEPSEDPTFTVGVIGATLGTVTSIFGLFRARLGGVFGMFSSTTILLGAVLLIVATAMLAMHIASTWPFVYVALFAASSLILAILCNLNDASIGRFYRDRLMEAFLPNAKLIADANKLGKPLAHNGEQEASDADKTTLTALASGTGAKHRPIHLINTNVLSWWAPDSRAQRRNGDNFILSALHCGSDMTMWKSTEHVAKNKLTLATAMAASGAAVNPQGGFAGQGPTTSVPVAVAMALLSLRLGYWLRWSTKFEFLGFGNHLHPGLSQMVKRLFIDVFLPGPKQFGKPMQNGKPIDNTPHFIELSDGGHFDNLGLYEMIRRECRLIVVCDGGHDPENSYESLSVLIRRVREDFSAEITFDVKFHEDWTRRVLAATGAAGKKTGPQDLVARQVKDEYPSGTEYAEKGYFLANITYHDNDNDRALGHDGYRAKRKPTGSKPRRGLLIYLKSTMIRDVDLTTKGYRGTNPLFPFDPTSNQFFSPEQFEAYRDLGQKTAAQMAGDLALRNLFCELFDKTEQKNTDEIAAELDSRNQFA